MHRSIRTKSKLRIEKLLIRNSYRIAMQLRSNGNPDLAVRNVTMIYNTRILLAKCLSQSIYNKLLRIISLRRNKLQLNDCVYRMLRRRKPVEFQQFRIIFKPGTTRWSFLQSLWQRLSKTLEQSNVYSVTSVPFEYFAASFLCVVTIEIYYFHIVIFCVQFGLIFFFSDLLSSALTQTLSKIRVQMD